MSSSDRFISSPGAPEVQPGQDVDASRRRLLRAAGSAAVLIPTVSLFGCSGEEKPGASAAAQAQAIKDEAAAAVSKAQDMAQDTADKAASAMDSAMDSMENAAATAADGAQQAGGDTMYAAAGGLVKIEESDPVAKALAYVHDASKVDTAAQPRFAAGQACTNCAQYKAVENGWGSCAIFPGKLVAGAGWCAGYIAAG